jgi:alpha-tubulin suppressor-like RCC1 family protein
MSNSINLLLIDFNTPDKQFIVDNLLPNTKYIEINSLVESYSEIQTKIQNLNEQRFNNVSIIRVNDKQFFNLSIHNITSVDSEELLREEFNNFRDFLLNLKNQYEMQFFDVITCNAYDTYWQQFITAFKNNYSLHIRTSANITGLGGDWILESDNINLVGLYFSENIVNYQYSLEFGDNTIVVDSNLQLFACGENLYGQLTNGNTTNSNLLLDMSRANISDKNPIQVARGNGFIVVLMSDGTLFSCGLNNYGQLGISIGNTNNSNILVAMTIPSGKTPIQIACGERHTVVLMSDGTLYGCGDNRTGQYGTGNITSSTILVPMSTINISGKMPIQFAAGSDHTIVIMADKSIYSCGYNNYGQLGRGIVGNNTYNVLNIMDTTNFLGKTPIQASCGFNHTAVLMSDGSIYVCGRNNFGQLGRNNFNNISILSSINTSSISGKTPIQIACGEQHMIILMSDNTLFSCGNNSGGKLGIETVDSSKNILTRMTTTNISNKIPIQIACGSHTIVLMSDGSIYGCGPNNAGQLGTGNNTDYYTLTQMNTTKDIYFVQKIIKPLITNLDASFIFTSTQKTISITGRYFVFNPTVKVDGSLVDSILVSNSQITFDISSNIAKNSLVTVSNNYGTSNSYQITYVNPPSISYLDVSFVSTLGGQTITINGSNFNYNPVVKIDGNLVTSTLISSTQITFVSPVNTSGTKSLTISNNIGSSNSYQITYIDPPSISYLDISLVSTLGGQTITINGSNFNYNPVVKIDGSLVASTLVSSSQITFISPVNTSGTKSVTVSNNFGSSDLFNITYVNPPSISYLDISLISTLGGQTVTINGSDFNYNPVVKINDSLVASTLVSSSQITFISPVNTSGTKSLTVSNNYGTSNSYQITYVNPPSISYLDISLVSTLGGETVTIHGSDFNYNPVVKINESLVNSIIVSSSQITFVSPVNTSGTKSVTVSNDFGSSDLFNITYINPPSISYLDISLISTLGGQTVTINGSDFNYNPVVKMDESLVTSILVSSSQITFISPINTSGTKSITVSNNFGSSDLFNITYVNPPSISYLDVSLVSTLGGQTVTINGSDFNYNPVVKINDSLIASTLVSSSQITFISPVNTSGTKSLTVSNDFGSSDSYQITYASSPSISYLDISLVSTLGGQTLTINGSDFNYNPVVKIDGSLVDSILVSSTQITFVSPVNTSGSKSVTVSNDFGNSNLFNITYINPPSISYLDISSVLIFGGETVTINGSDFNYNPILKIDGSLVPSTIISSNQITFVTSVPNSYGSKSVTLTNMFGTSNSVLIQYVTEPISNICFLAGTPIQCDQGLIPIEQINPNMYTIRGNKIETITKTVTLDKYLVCIEKDALAKNIPSQKTLISKNHTLLYNRKMVKAKELLNLNNQKIYKVNYNREILYNVLLKNKHDKMIVNNLICETLDPKNGIAKLYFYIKDSNYTVEQKNSFIQQYNNRVIEKKAFI